MPDAVKISAGGMKSLLGLDPTKVSDARDSLDNISFINRYSPAELKQLLNRIYVNPNRDGIGNNTVTAGGIISFLKPVHEKIGNQKLEANKLRKLAPEIDQSRTLVASSILSPNDLQDGEFTFDFEDIDTLQDEPELLDAITDLYAHYFNGILRLGIKSYEWIGEAMYGSGSKCVLILPNNTQIDLRHRDQSTVNKSVYRPEAAFESFQEFCKKDDDYLFSGKKLSWSAYFKSEQATTKVSDLVPSMESYGIKIPTAFRSDEDVRILRMSGSPDLSMYGGAYTAGIESMVINLKAKMAEGDIIRITENTDSFRYIGTKKQRTEQDIWDKLNQKYQFKKRPAREEIAILKDNPNGIDQIGHPTLIELPSEAVVPIFIPGAPDQHLGYFVLLDMYGQPLTIENSGAANTDTGCQAGSSNAAFEAMFGNNCCNASYFNNNNSYSQMGNLIFSNMLDGYIRTRMKGIFHRDDLEIGRYNALSTLLFYRTLQAKESMLVFVPPMLMQYFAFEYDPNTGCGKSKLSDIQFILSLRTTLMMANVVAAVNDAVEHKRIEFGVDDKNANIEAIMELIANIFIEKNKLNGSVDPSEIMRDMYSNSLTIVPKNIPGLSDMQVDVQQAGGQSSRVDDQTLEQLNNLIVSQLDVPPSALNQLNEPEYARSLVVGNLFFAKKITRYQRIWCDMIDKFVRTYTLVDPVFRKALRKKISLYGKLPVKEKLPPKVAQLKLKNPNLYSGEIDDLADMIFNRVRSHLPKPNIAVDKAQFEEISNYINNIQQLADIFFNQEIIPSDDQLAQASLPVAKAKWKSDQVAKFISEVGSFKMCDIPNMDDADLKELTDFIQVFQNLGAGLNKQRTSLSQPSEDNGGGFGGDGGYGGSSDFGDASGGDMGGDLGGDLGGDDLGGDLGGGDMGGDLGGDMGGTSESNSSESSNSESSGGESDFDKLGGASMVATNYINNLRKGKKK